MRILRDGNEIQKDCPKCKSTLGIVPSDVQDCASVGTWVMCPVCGAKIDMLIGSMSTNFKRWVKWDE